MTNDIKCCVSCGWGSGSTLAEEVKIQTEKHGEFICKTCEVAWESILQTPKDTPIMYNKGYGSPCETVITEDNMYYFDGPKVDNPNNSFLGFGGSWILIIKSYPTKHGFERRPIVTNNLWHSRRIPKPYQQKMKDAGKVDSQIIWAGKELLAQLRDTLNKTSYLPEVMP